MYHRNPNASYIRELIDIGNNVKGSPIKETEKEQVKIEIANLLKQQIQHSKDISNARKEAY